MITAHTLELLAQAVAKVGLQASGRAALREAFSQLKLTFCLLDEMEASQPYQTYPGFSLFLVGASDHCVGLTRQLAQAVGVVIAEGDSEEDEAP